MGDGAEGGDVGEAVVVEVGRRGQVDPVGGAEGDPVAGRDVVRGADEPLGGPRGQVAVGAEGGDVGDAVAIVVGRRRAVELAGGAEGDVQAGAPGAGAEDDPGRCAGGDVAQRVDHGDVGPPVAVEVAEDRDDSRTDAGDGADVVHRRPLVGQPDIEGGGAGPGVVAVGGQVGLAVAVVVPVDRGSDGQAGHRHDRLAPRRVGRRGPQQQDPGPGQGGDGAGHVGVDAPQVEGDRPSAVGGEGAIGPAIGPEPGDGEVGVVPLSPRHAGQQDPALLDRHVEGLVEVRAAEVEGDRLPAPLAELGVEFPGGREPSDAEVLVAGDGRRDGAGQDDPAIGLDRQGPGPVHVPAAEVEGDGLHAVVAEGEVEGAGRGQPDDAEVDVGGTPVDEPARHDPAVGVDRQVSQLVRVVAAEVEADPPPAGEAEGEVGGAVRVDPDDHEVGVRGADLDSPPDDDLAGRLDGDAVGLVLIQAAEVEGVGPEAGAGVEGGVERAVGVEPGDAEVEVAAAPGHAPHHDDPAVGLDGHGVDPVRVGAPQVERDRDHPGAAEGGVERAVGLDPGHGEVEVAPGPDDAAGDDRPAVGQRHHPGGDPAGKGEPIGDPTEGAVRLVDRPVRVQPDEPDGVQRDGDERVEHLPDRDDPAVVLDHQRLGGVEVAAAEVEADRLPAVAVEGGIDPPVGGEPGDAEVDPPGRRLDTAREDDRPVFLHRHRVTGVRTAGDQRGGDHLPGGERRQAEAEVGRAVGVEPDDAEVAIGAGPLDGPGHQEVPVGQQRQVAGLVSVAAASIEGDGDPATRAEGAVERAVGVEPGHGEVPVHRRHLRRAGDDDPVVPLHGQRHALVPLVPRPAEVELDRAQAARAEAEVGRAVLVEPEQAEVRVASAPVDGPQHEDPAACVEGDVGGGVVVGAAEVEADRLPAVAIEAEVGGAVGQQPGDPVVAVAAGPVDPAHDHNPAAAVDGDPGGRVEVRPSQVEGDRRDPVAAEGGVEPAALVVAGDEEIEVAPARWAERPGHDDPALGVDRRGHPPGGGDVEGDRGPASFAEGRVEQCGQQRTVLQRVQPRPSGGRPSGAGPLPDSTPVAAGKCSAFDGVHRRFLSGGFPTPRPSGCGFRGIGACPSSVRLGLFRRCRNETRPRPAL